MFVFRRDPDADLGVGVAFTSADLDLSDGQGETGREAAYAALAASLGVPVAVTTQVHSDGVLAVGEQTAPAASGLVDLTGQQADALVTTRPGVALAVRVADCVPICIAAADGSAVAAVHAGRSGLMQGVIAAAVDRLRADTDADLVGWVGPHVCGACYEVPAAMAEDAVARLGIAPTTTSWGTPSIDLGAAALAQLGEAGVDATAVGGCTLHGTGLHSHRGGDAGRQVGLVWIAPR
ncbi:polyphenol oxidase family protein [Propioniciclava sp. MC1595]|uniref:polyphenol oxidase family protein n=1 Tax=Propioniciclava sp. MC1595 TaxID=2760308 RepID=UPI001662877E|nr:polyphenol oxidase family protein [Propioniciclava sp. MC1595]MBB1493691.1 polyphenol oxidase family protein [Propioniciclava sp. MC1595]QTE27075.1 polyphenol oxidase family protein [Propioniciclava sp. MC1595]